MYKKRELESSFVEITISKKKSIICGCIYKHPSMDIKEFIDDHLNIELEKNSKEKSNIFLMGDFNINLLNINSDKKVTEFFDNMVSNSLIPYVINPTRITPFFKNIN